VEAVTTGCGLQHALHDVEQRHSLTGIEAWKVAAAAAVVKEGATPAGNACARAEKAKKSNNSGAPNESVPVTLQTHQRMLDLIHM
jgi:hypothetical protein